MKDLRITDDGDLIIGANGDLDIISGDEQLAQSIVFRLKTYQGDYTLTNDLGLSLEDFIGRQNNAATRLLIEEAVRGMLVTSYAINTAEVRCIPLSEDEVYILIEIPSLEDDEKLIQVSSQLDLQRGLVFNRIEFSIA